MVILMLFLVLFQNFNLNVNVAYAKSNQTYFARINADNVYFYKNPIDNEDSSNLYFKLPKTFFVELTDSYDSVFYSAKYLDMTGYVKKENVQPILGRPQMPYLNNLSVRVFNEISRDMRKVPSTSGGIDNHITYVQLNSQNIIFYGEIVGESLNSYRTSIWYYCKYTADKDYYGYIYSDYCDNGFGKPIILPENSEEVTYTTSPDFSIQESKNLETMPVESKTTWIVIVVLSIPAIVFLIMILKSAKFSKAKHINKSEIKDY